jgi:uncharacterized DUF497 family protein
MKYNFEWDPTKEASNVDKHGVTFEQAANVFKDPLALTLYDEEDSSQDEDRWVTLGLVNGQHYLVVIHTYRNPQPGALTIRIISARPANKREIRLYEEGKRDA